MHCFLTMHVLSFRPLRRLNGKARQAPRKMTARQRTVARGEETIDLLLCSRGLGPRWGLCCTAAAGSEQNSFVARIPVMQSA